MKIYAIANNSFGGCGYHSLYLSKEKAEKKSSQMRKELLHFKIGDIMCTHVINEEEATKLAMVTFSNKVYEVTEIQVND